MKSSAESELITFKIVIIGDTGVGKTSMMLRYTDNSFSNSFISTIGIDSKKKFLETQGKKIEVQIWDTAGQEKFHSLSRSFFRDVDGIIFTYDLTRKVSFENISYWVYIYENEAENKNVKKMLIGNKCDCENDRKIMTKQGLQFANQHKMYFYETSAKANTNIDESFMDIVNGLVKMKLDNPKEQLNNTCNLKETKKRKEKCTCMMES